jgi:hypothetical protein
MPARFVNVDRNTPMFLPYDLREWVPAEHIVHFILEAVEQISIDHFQVIIAGRAALNILRA